MILESEKRDLGTVESVCQFCFPFLSSGSQCLYTTSKRAISSRSSLACPNVIHSISLAQEEPCAPWSVGGTHEPKFQGWVDRGCFSTNFTPCPQEPFLGMTQALVSAQTLMVSFSLSLGKFAWCPFALVDLWGVTLFSIFKYSVSFPHQTNIVFEICKYYHR